MTGLSRRRRSADVKLFRTTRPVAAVRGAGALCAAVLLLSACGGVAPGVAAEVEGERITDEQVDDFAEVLCAIGGVQGTEAGVPAKSARFASLQILLANQLTELVADVEDVQQDQVASVLQGMAAARDLLSEDQQETFDEVAEEFARAQTALVELGRASLAEQGQPEQPAQDADDAAFAEGQRLMAEGAQDADVEVDPRFGELVDGGLQPSNGSLSVPVSDLAVQADSPQPGEELITLLPASQKCAPPS
jgi:hypothetical protein